MPTHVLVVESDRRFRRSLTATPPTEEVSWTEAGTMRDALRALAAEEFDVVLLALRLSDGDGLELLPRVLALQPTTPVIVVTAFSSIGSAVQAMRLGAFDYLPKPVSTEQLLLALHKALETRALRREMARITNENLLKYGLDAIIGQSRATGALREQVRRIAHAPATTVLVQGESGSGKDLVAKAIHYTGHRAAGPFVAINCSAIPEALLESELFGYEPGAFTDAKSLKRGSLEVASGGTVFLDEVAELGFGLQAKLLRFLEEHTLRRVGGTKDIAVDLRVVAATNVKLEIAVARGLFREDLYYRLKIVPIAVPPLRERVEDIPLLARHFMEHFNRKFRKHFEAVTPEAMERLCAYRWPGNVRELKNTIERAVILEDGPLLDVGMLVLSGAAPVLPPASASTRDALEEDLTLEQIEQRAFVRALERAGGNQSQAAKLLGVSRDTVRHWMRKNQVRLETRVLVSPR